MAVSLRIQSWFSRAIELLTSPSPVGFLKILTWLWMLALLVLGLGLWWWFLNRGAIQFDLHDWVEASKRYAFLQDALKTGQFPLHMPGTSGLRTITDRYLSVVDTLFSPQIILLGILDLGEFVVANTWLLFGAGFAGLLLLKKELKLSLLSFTLLYLLLFFNGHVVDHIAVGHIHWAAYFLIPYFILAVVKLIGGETGWRWTLWVSILVLIFMLQGAYHLVVIALFSLVLIIPARTDLTVPIIRVGVASLLLSMIRILPPLLHYGAFDTEFLSGFSSSANLLSGLIELREMTRASIMNPSPLSPLDWWELDYFIGLAGLGFILFFGAWKSLRSPDDKGLARATALPILALSILSIGRIYKIFHLLQIPLLSTQRVSSRLFILPLAFLALLAVVQFDRWTREERYRGAGAVLGASAICVVGNDLWQHFKLWRVTNMAGIFPKTPLELSRFYVANHPDPIYAGLIWVGLSVTALTLIVLVLKAIRELADR